MEAGWKEAPLQTQLALVGSKPLLSPWSNGRQVGPAGSPSSPVLLPSILPPPPPFQFLCAPGCFFSRLQNRTFDSAESRDFGGGCAPVVVLLLPSAGQTEHFRGGGALSSALLLRARDRLASAWGGGGGEKEECAKGPNRGGRGKTGRWHPFAALHLSWEGAPCVPSVPPVLAYLAIFVVPTKVCRWQLQVAGTNVSQAAPRRPLPPPPRVPLPGCSCQTSAPLSEWPQQPPHNCMKKPPTPRRHLGGDPKGEGRPAGERGFQATCFSPPTSTPPPKCCSRDLIPPRASPSLYCVQAPGRAGGGGGVVWTCFLGVRLVPWKRQLLSFKKGGAGSCRPVPSAVAAPPHRTSPKGSPEGKGAQLCPNPARHVCKGKRRLGLASALSAPRGPRHTHTHTQALLPLPVLPACQPAALGGPLKPARAQRSRPVPLLPPGRCWGGPTAGGGGCCLVRPGRFAGSAGQAAAVATRSRRRLCAALIASPPPPLFFGACSCPPRLPLIQGVLWAEQEENSPAIWD